MNVVIRTLAVLGWRFSKQPTDPQYQNHLEYLVIVLTSTPTQDILNQSICSGVVNLKFKRFSENSHIPYF